ncbi:ABC transporter permease [Roseivirga sp. E12]|uniref:ABC transporter permease n=1 Tax=Roseivirga sp. E12 TaxID=2819237 RepID=UPI001ABC27B4|nr:ABC transporter permease [Roseivirga sp. E12]MBO3698432.1 ABC transporter permease [Roseivirga sp. E12]
MIKNYLKVAFRNLLRNKFYSILNISGLAIGIACCLLIVLFVTDELSYDRYYDNSENTYRLTMAGALNGSAFDLAVVGDVVGKTLVEDFPEVIEYVRFRQNGSPFIRSGENIFKEEKYVWADQSVIDIFDLVIVSGDPSTALSAPKSLMMSETAAKKYFGDQEAIGQQVEFGQAKDYRVTAVYKDIPSNTHFDFDVIGSLLTLDESRQNMWMNMNFQTYVVLTPGADLAKMAAQFPDMLKKYIGPEVKKFLNIEWEEMEQAGSSLAFALQPVVDIHLTSDLQGELDANSDKSYVYIFSAIAFFILLIACINFMNLATARSAHRAKEVGVRKVLGSVKSQLIYQFLAESILISFISFVLAVGIAYLALPFFNDLSAKQLVIPFENPLFLGSIFAGVLLVGFLAGSYPAFFLSAFKPVTVLKGSLSNGMKSGALRSVLVVIQFCTSIFLVIGTLVILNQLEFIQNKNLGFDRDQVLIVNDAYLARGNTAALKTKIESFPEVKSASLSGFLPTPSNNNMNLYFNGVVPSEGTQVIMSSWTVDYEYLETLGIDLIEGRNFSRDFATDSTAIIINEAALKELEIEGDPLGKIIGTFVSNEGDIQGFTIVGIVKDFHYQTLKSKIGPLALQLGNSTGLLNLKVNTRDYAGLLGKLESSWMELAPNQPFETSFLDDRFNRMYDAEQRLGKIFGVFATLTIVVACLGLFGLAAYTAENRIKEVGIRKVLGASVGQIVFLLSRDMGKLVLIAFIFGAPLAWYAMNNWLQGFEYRTSIGWTIFAMTALGSLFIALITMSYQSLKAAVSNPVKSLRTE